MGNELIPPTAKLSELLGPEPKYYKVHSSIVQKHIEDITGSPRYWTAYSADFIESILRQVKIIPLGAYYMGFLPHEESLAFREMVYDDAYIDYTGPAPRKISKEEFDRIAAVPKDDENKNTGVEGIPDKVHGDEDLH